MTSRFYILLATCLILFMFGQPAVAKVQVGVEPYLGYSQFTLRENAVSEQKYGTVLGGKGGIYVNEKIWIALDYHLGGPYLLQNDSNNEYLNRMWGVGLGIRNRGKVGGWIGYYYDSQIEDIEHNAILKGTAIKISGGVDIDSKLSVNIEYCEQTYLPDTRNQLPETIRVSVLFLSLSSPLFLN